MAETQHEDPAIGADGEARRLLREVFGHEQFRGDQAEVVRHAVAGGDALVLMPTGGGKSLCYQLPALLLEGTVVVVSPLIALMQDQVRALRHVGVRAAFLNSTLSAEESRSIAAAFAAGELDLLYAAPERLLSPGFSDFLRRGRVALFAIDEAHCVSQWGHDFRPEYLRLRELLDCFEEIPRLALTATADAFTRDQIVERLFVRPESTRQFVASFDRPNIYYRVELKGNEMSRVTEFIRARPAESGIVYVRTRARAEQVAEKLVRAGVNALPYHAGLPVETRSAHQERFLGQPGQVICATIAFGMGIDKPDVRFVIHLDLPASMESYYQETGRAGRDREAALAWMFYSLGDVVSMRRLMDSSSGNADYRRVQEVRLGALLGYCETIRCRRQVLLEYFGEARPEPCGHCDVCEDPPATWDATEAARKALSNVYRTGQRFGAGHLVDVLVGKDSERIRSLRHDTVSTYGIGADLPAETWKSVYRQLAALGLIHADPEHGGFRLAAGSRPVLKGEDSVRLRVDVRQKRRRSTSAPRDAEEPELTPDEEALFRRLVEERRGIASEEAIPPYMVFHDRTLLAMVRSGARTRGALLEVPGVGEVKLERFGDRFLAVLGGSLGEAVSSDSP